MRKAWFVYQLGSKHPSPAIIYDKLPDDAAGKSSLKPKIIQQHEIDNLPRDPDGEILDSFDTLMRLFPYTGDLYSKQAEPVEPVSEIEAAFGPAELR